MQRDSIANTFVVAVSLCVVCAVLVSAAAVGLRPLQEANQRLDQQKNILLAAGLIDTKAKPKDIEETFGSRVETLMVSLETGEVLETRDDTNSETFEAFDALKAAKSGDDERRIILKDDPAGIKTRENSALVYRIKDESGKTQQYVFPIRGYGLWSTLFGYLALDADMETINGISYYQHGETPGLGGEVDNPNWKAQWKGKKLYEITTEGGETERQVALDVVKGLASSDTEIDGLSGASITSQGVENMMKFWFGPQGFMPFIKNVSASPSPSDA